MGHPRVTLPTAFRHVSAVAAALLGIDPGGGFDRQQVAGIDCYLEGYDAL